MSRRLRWLCLLPMLASPLVTPVQSTASTSTTFSFAAAMQQASQSRQVPLPLIEAIAHVNSRWEVIGTPAADGGVGPMHVIPAQMAQATALSGHTATQIANDPAANLDAGAALLAHAHTSGTDLSSWSGATATTQGSGPAVEIWAALRAGASRTTSTGETITLDPQPVGSTIPSARAPNAAVVTTSLMSCTTDYPGVYCVPASTSNYTVANRPHDYPIDLIVIHDTEESAAAAIQQFQNPTRAASAHYVVDDAGNVTQMVPEKDVAWHAGNWDYNTRAIGIEHEGMACCTGWYTTAMYNASAHLIARACSVYGVPMDRTHVIGHSEVPDPNNPGLFGGSEHHTDPGPHWDWTYYMHQANLYADALPSPPHMMTSPSVITQDGGATVSWVGQTCHLAIASYQVVVQPGNMIINLPGTATSTVLTGLTNGTTYTVTVTATNADGTDSNSTQLIPSPPCTKPTLTAAPASPGGTGGAIALTGGTSGCLNPTYRFWVQPSGGSWVIGQDYGTSNTYSWPGSGTPADYEFEVDVRQKTSAIVYDAVTDIPYAITGCTAAGLSPDSVSPQPPGTTVVLTGSATCRGTPEYRFWTRAPGGAWGIVQDYSPTSTYSWNTAGKAMGAYSWEVDVRDQGATATYESVANIPYTLGPATCHNAGLTASPASPGAAGAPVTFTATSSGCPSPRYRFWIAAPGGRWTVEQNYSPTSTFTWTTTSTPGSYRVEADVRDATSSASYDSVNNIPYVVAGCTAAQLSTDKPSPQLTGTASITLTGAATCPGTPDYRFWIRPPGGSWSIVQNYSPTATYAWNTLALPAGTYSLEVDLRDHGSTASYETVKNTTFTLGGCIAAGLSAKPASPQASGTAVMFTGSATCLATPQYRFWVRAPGGAWTIVQDYSPSATFSWTTTGKPAGAYAIELDVRNQSSTATYESVSNVTYVLS